jgi:putative ABC transport system permease protein|tara:strand:- start:16 stop:1257 length:1242 start_codon:yes stop_codon:yes gene_type:complete
MKSRNIKNMLKESFWMAIDSIRKNKLRSSLTLLGISIGVFSVIGVMTAIRTLESSVESGLNVFATNTFVIQKYPGISFNDRKYRKRKNIDYTQYEKLKNRAQLPILVSVSEQSSVRDVKYKDRTVKNSVGLIGGDEGTVRCYNTYIADGRNFINEDIHHIRNVCILGMDVVDRLFPFEDPLGKRIHIEGLDYMVIGLTERQGELFGESKDNFIAIPITTYLKRFSERWTTLSIDVESQSELTYEKTKDEVIGLMRSIRKVRPEEDNDFEIVTNTEMIEQFSGFTSGIKLFALFVSVIALVVAGIGIMNIMLVSVTERIKEIGIRKAIGATKNDILTQFLMEAIFLSQFGGIVGIIMGVSGGNIVSFLFKIPAVIPFDWALIGLVVCSVIGIGFGIYPAWRAAQLDPIESLRFE